MRKHIAIITLGTMITLGLLSMTVLFQVDEFRDIVIVKRFGKVRAIYRGREDAGLHVKLPWPIERVVRYEARNMTFEDVYSEMETNDKQQVLVSMFCTWRIREGQEKLFLRKIETIDKAQERIRTALKQSKDDVFGQHQMGELINTDPALIKLREVDGEILAATRKKVEDVYGVEIRMVDVKVWGLSEEVSREVIKAQKKERSYIAQDFKSRGDAEATAIVERAKSASLIIQAFANILAAEKRAEGDRAAAREYRKFSANPELATFLRYLATMKAALKERTVLVLNGANILPSVKWFLHGPRPIPVGVSGMRLPETSVPRPATSKPERTVQPEAAR